MSETIPAESRSDGANPLWGDLAALRKLFPDARYVGTVARRQAVFACLVAALVAPFTLVSALTRQLTYTSSASIAFDPRDAAGDALGLVGFKQVAERFHNIGETSFLEPLVANVQVDAAPDSPVLRLLEAATDRLRRVTGAPAGEGQEGARRDAALDRLQKSVNGWGEEDAMVLRLTVDGDSPELAQAWTARIADAFIQTELKAELARVSNLELAYAQIEQQKSERTAGAAKASAGDAETILHLQEREAALTEQLQLARVVTSEATGALAKRRAELLGELSRLKTTLGPSHPDVVAKEDELQQFLRASGSSGGLGGSRGVQEELATVRTKLRLAGAPSLQEGGNLFDVNTRLLRLRADKAHLERQVRDPGQRSRYRVVRDAFLPSAPKKSRSSQVLMALLTTFFLAGGLAASREALSPRASDAWRVAAATRLPALATFSWSLVRRAAELTPERIDRLRNAIGEHKMLSSTPVQLFLEYRKLIRALQTQGLGRRVLFVSLGEGARTAAVLYDFLRIYATETGEPTVVVDLDGADPLAAHGLQGGPSAGFGGDVCDLLSGAAKWQDVRLTRTAERPFDLVPPPGELSAEKVRGLKKAQTQKLLEALERSYKAIFVRGLKFNHALENGAFAAAVTDVVLLVDGRTARRDDVARALADLGSGLVRGFVLIDD